MLGIGVILEIFYGMEKIGVYGWNGEGGLGCGGEGGKGVEDDIGGTGGDEQDGEEVVD